MWHLAVGWVRGSQVLGSRRGFDLLVMFWEEQAQPRQMFALLVVLSDSVKPLGRSEASEIVGPAWPKDLPPFWEQVMDGFG